MTIEELDRGLTIVVPALNEADCIAEVIDGIAAVAQRHLDRFEIVAVNDGSDDATGEILDELANRFPQLIAVNHEHRRGVGAGFHAGLAKASMPFITVVPGDGAFPPESLEPVFKMVGTAHHIGTVRLNQFSARGAFRWLYSRTYNFLIGWLLQLPVSDLHSLHVYSVEALRRSRLLQEGYLYGIEALAAADIRPQSLQEVGLSLKPDRANTNRSFQLSTLIDLLGAIARLQHRIFSGLARRDLLVAASLYSLVLSAACVYFRNAPSLQDISGPLNGPLLGFIAANLAILPALFLFPLALGLLLLSLFDRRSNVAEPSADHILLAYIGGMAVTIPIGFILGAAGLLQQTVLLPLLLTTIWLGLMRHPGALNPLIDYILLRDRGPSRLLVALRLLIWAALLLVLFGIAIPVDIASSDVMQIYYAFLARVKTSGGFQVDPSVPDLSDFLIGRGNGLHLVFAATFHPYVGGIIGFAYVVGLLTLVRRVATLSLESTIAPHLDLRTHFWPLVPELLVFATLVSALLSVEFAKYHLQIGFFVVSSIYVIVLNSDESANAELKARILASAAVALALPIILPQYAIFAAILLGAAVLPMLVRQDWRAVTLISAIGLLAGVSCLGSLTFNYLNIGTPELYPSAVFARLTDAAVFARYSSDEVWQYLHLAQALDGETVQLTASTAERMVRFLSETAGNILLPGASWQTFFKWIDAYKTGLNATPLFAVASLSPLLLVTLAVWRNPAAGTRTVLGTIIILFFVSATAAMLILHECGLDRSCIREEYRRSVLAGAWPGAFVIAAAVSFHAMFTGWVAAIVAGGVARPTELRAHHIASKRSSSFLESALPALAFVLLGMALLYGLAATPSIDRLFFVFIPVTSILLILFACLIATPFLNSRAQAAEIARRREQPARVAIENRAAVAATLLALTLGPGVFLGILATAREFDLIFTVFGSVMNVIIVLLASATLYGILYPDPDRQTATAPRTGSDALFKGISLSRWQAMDGRFFSLLFVFALTLFAFDGVRHARQHLVRPAQNLALIFAGNGAQGGADFQRCIEIGRVVGGRGKVLAVDALMTMVPCFAPIGLPPGMFVHHYNSIIATRYRLVLFGKPSEIEAFLRSHKVDFFYVDRTGKDRIWGHGFSPLFDARELAKRFNLYHESPEYYLLTWKDSGGHPLQESIVEELRDSWKRKRELQAEDSNWRRAELAYNALKEKLEREAASQ